MKTNRIRLGKNQLANRVQWVRDLDSGKFKQGGGRLKVLKSVGGRKEERYCCLGVACERVAPNSYALQFSYAHMQSNGAYMDTDVAFKFGLDHYTDQQIAGQWNDSQNYSFNRIADLIAYATDKRVRFSAVRTHDVPDGFAVEWLKQFN